MNFWVRLVDNLDVVSLSAVLGVIIGWILAAAQLRESRRQTQAMEVPTQFLADSKCEVLENTDGRLKKVRCLVFSIANRGLREIILSQVYFYIDGKFISGFPPNNSSGTMPFTIKPGSRYDATFNMESLVEFLKRCYPDVFEGEVIAEDQCNNKYKAKWKV